MSNTANFTVRVTVEWDDGTVNGFKTRLPEPIDSATAWVAFKHLLNLMGDEFFWNFDDRYPGQHLDLGDEPTC